MAKSGICLTSLFALLFLPVTAVDASLEVGDKAPPLHISEWVQGDPVDLEKDVGKRIYMVEFWATWCPPCKMSVPLLTDLQKKYANDLTIIGVTATDPRNSVRDVRGFVKEQGAQMAYTVAIDDAEKTSSAYMDAAGAMGIPHAFIVGKDGRILWQGSPLDPTLDSVLEQIVSGKYDIDSALKSAKLEAELGKRFEEVYMYIRFEQWSRVWDGLVGIVKLDPANIEAMDLLMQVYLSERQSRDSFKAWVRGHIADHRQNSEAMQNLARVLCANPDFTTRLPDQAIEAARAAYEATQGKDAMATTTYALALYQIAALDQAIDLQRKAVELASGPERGMAQEALDFYLQCKELQGTLR